jgi:hypothetical protein
MSEAELRTYAAKVQKDAQEARQEAGRYRTAAQQAEQERQERERAEMSELQRVQKDLETATTRSTTLESQVRDLTVGAAARDALTAAGAINAATALKVLGADAVTVKEDGTVDAAALAKVITDLKKTDAYLFRRTASANAGAGQGAGASPEGTGGSINDMIRGGRR